MTRLSLSNRQAQNCEAALTDRCRCRCQGALHGARRFAKSTTDNQSTAETEWFEALPVDDPHHLPTREERKAQRNARRRERRAELAQSQTQHQTPHEVATLQENRRRLIQLALPYQPDKETLAADDDSLSPAAAAEAEGGKRDNELAR